MTGRPGQHGGVAHDDRRLLNAVTYVCEAGIAWRDLPSQYGKWDTIYHRFNAWGKRGRWEAILTVLRDPGREWRRVDRAIVRAHPHAAGTNTGGRHDDLGRSRGGFGTAVHVGFDAPGHPAAVARSPGRDAGLRHAEAVVGDLRPPTVVKIKILSSMYCGPGGSRRSSHRGLTGRLIATTIV